MPNTLNKLISLQLKRESTAYNYAQVILDNKEYFSNLTTEKIVSTLPAIGMIDNVEMSLLSIIREFDYELEDDHEFRTVQGDEQIKKAKTILKKVTDNIKQFSY